MKAFISFFFKKPKKKRSVKVAPSNPVHDGGAMSTMATGIGQTVEWEDAAARTSTGVSDELQMAQEMEDDEEEGVMDDGKAAHDAEAVSSVAQEAIALAQTKHQLKMTQQEERDASALFSKVRVSFLCLLV